MTLGAGAPYASANGWGLAYIASTLSNRRSSITATHGPPQALAVSGCFDGQSHRSQEESQRERLTRHLSSRATRHT